MTYDEDLKRARRFFIAMGLVNAIYVPISLFLRRDWLVALACALWSACCFLLLVFARVNQGTRDEMRLIRSMISGVLEQAKHERE